MKRILLTLRLAVEAVILVVLFHVTFLLISFSATKPRAHIVSGMAGIGATTAGAVIAVRDALRVRVRLNDLEIAALSRDSENGQTNLGAKDRPKDELLD